MVSVLLSRLVILTAGTLYPAYRSYKAVKTKNVREYVKWMMYWIVFAMFLCIETLADVFVAFWFPFYYEVKILFVIWLLSPYTKGASFLYRKFIHPTLNRHEEDIDLYLDRVKTEGYSALVRFGSKGINYAKEVVATAAIKGQVQLVNQLKKSYSLNDVTDSSADGAQAKLTALDFEKRTAAEERVWEGYYDDDGEPVVEKEFQYLQESGTGTPVTKTQDDGTTGLKPRTRRANHNDVDAYATLPRRSNRTTTAGTSATKRPPLSTS